MKLIKMNLSIPLIAALLVQIVLSGLVFFNPLTLKSKFSKCFIKACLQLGTPAKGYDVIHEYFHSLQTNN